MSWINRILCIIACLFFMENLFLVCVEIKNNSSNVSNIIQTIASVVNLIVVVGVGVYSKKASDNQHRFNQKVSWYTSYIAPIIIDAVKNIVDLLPNIWTSMALSTEKKYELQVCLLHELELCLKRVYYFDEELCEKLSVEKEKIEDAVSDIMCNQEDPFDDYNVNLRIKSNRLRERLLLFEASFNKCIYDYINNKCL